MLVIIYKTINNHEKRQIWTLADAKIPDIKIEDVYTLIATSFELSFLQKKLNEKYDIWYDDDARRVYTILKEEFTNPDSSY